MPIFKKKPSTESKSPTKPKKGEAKPSKVKRVLNNKSTGSGKPKPKVGTIRKPVKTATSKTDKVGPIKDDVAPKINKKTKLNKTVGKAKVKNSGKDLAKLKPKAVKLDNKVLEKNKKKRFLTLRMYSYKLFNWLLKGSLDDRDPNLASDSMQIGYGDVFTQNHVTRYFTVSYMDEDVPVATMSRIIQEMKRDNDVWNSISMKIINKNYGVDFSSTTIRNRLKSWARQLNAEVVQEVDPNNVGSKNQDDSNNVPYALDLDTTSRRKKTARMFRSFFTIRDNAAYTKESTVIFKVQTKTKKDMMVTHRLFVDTARQLGLAVNHVNGTVLDFMRAYSPISKRTTVSSTTTNKVLLTAKNMSEMLPYRQGKIGDMGLWFGMDKDSGSAVWLDIMGTPEAKNILLMGFTGSGKTFGMSMLLMFHDALGHNIFVHDHKGNEFVAFTKSRGGLVVSMTPSKTCFINVFVISTESLTTVDELRGAFTESVGLSELVFMTLTEPNADELRDYKNIFNDYLTYVHNTVGVVSDNVETYSKSRVLTPEYLYKLFDSFSSAKSKSIVDTYGTKMLFNIKNSLYRYWHKNGTRNELFSNEINMDEIRRNRIVCFDFGMAETTRNSVPKNEDKLKKIFMNVSASRFTNHNKKQKEWTVKVVEEIQSADEDVLAFTSADVTEGRAKNMINYVLGNATGTLAKGGQYANNIIENMNIHILGKLSKSARDFYVTQFDLQSMRGSLEKIAKDPEYKYCFLLNCTITETPSTAIVQFIATKKVAESKYFKTVDTE